MNSEDAPPQVTVDHLFHAQVTVSPIEDDYEVKMKRRQEALSVCGEAKIYPTPPAIFWWFHRREVAEGVFVFVSISCGIIVFIFKAKSSRPFTISCWA